MPGLLSDSSEAAYQSDDLAENPDLPLARVHHDGFHRPVLGLEHDAGAVPEIALHRRLGVAARFGLEQGDDDIVGLSRLLAPHQDEVAVADVRVDHALAPDTEREHVRAVAGKRRGRDGDLALDVLGSEVRRTRGDAAQDRHRPELACAGGRRERERPRGAPGARSSLERALTLERAKVVEGGAGRDLESVADLAHGRRHRVPSGEALDEAQNLPLSPRELSHAAASRELDNTQRMLSLSRKKREALRPAPTARRPGTSR